MSEHIEKKEIDIVNNSDDTLSSTSEEFVNELNQPQNDKYMEKYLKYKTKYEELKTDNDKNRP